MAFDIFCSLAQAPRNGVFPSHAQMLREFEQQVLCADQLGYGCVWTAESHFSTEAQKTHREPVIPH